MTDIVDRLRAMQLPFAASADTVTVNEAADEIERLRQCLRWQDDRDGRIGTHSAECYKFGHRHYECALAEIERLRACVRHASAQSEAFKAEADAIRDAWATAAQTTDS